MKEPFLHPRFDGKRFEEHTLPLDVARDLAAYEVLIVELAKRLYLDAHPNRKRVPKGFEAGFQLHLEQVDQGSARPLLSLITAGTLALSGGSGGYFEKARDLVAECIASADGTLPEKFPKELLAHFNQVGRSLQAGESMEIPRPGRKDAILTPQRRRDLVLAADDYYQDKVELAGTIEEANWKSETFRLRLSSGEPVDVPMPIFFRKDAGEYGGRDRFQVTVTGIATYDAKGQLHSVLKVRSVDVQPDYQIASRFDQIGSLAAGWHEGAGVAIDPEKLATLYDTVVGHYPEDLPLPAIVPTTDGNLLFEWKGPASASLDLRLADLFGDFHAFDKDGHDVERSFTLVSSENWRELFVFLRPQLAGDNA